MKRILTAVFIGFLGCAMTCVDLSAQATAQISGTVRDQSGAVLPGVEVTATQTDTGIGRTTVTNETGTYVLPNLPLGPYRLEAGLPGFRTFVQTGIVLQVNNNAVINLVLEVGQVSEQVEVQANTSLVETRSASVGQIMETQRIVELPLNGRNAQELLLLGGGAVQMATQPGGTAFPGRVMISSAGGRGQSMDYTLDGIRHVDPWDGVVMPLPFPDALAEFKTETSGLSAQQTRAAAVSVVTKSGTKDFHGALFEFVRNDLFNARSYFANKGSTLKRNQFGGTLGGPILKNKIFFFGGYQGTTTRQDPADTRAFVPTAAMLAGDFTGYASAACNSRGAVTLRAPFVNNRLDPALFSPAALRLSSRLPKAENPCGEVHYGRKNDDDSEQIVARIDYQLSAKHSLFGRYLHSHNDRPSPFKYSPDNVLTTAQGTEAFGNSIVFGSTYLISPTTINSFRVAYGGDNLTRIAPAYFDSADLGIKAHSNVPDVMNINVTSGFSMSGAPGAFKSHLYQIADDVNLTRGQHQFGFGVHLGEARTHSASNSDSAGNFTFSGSITGLGLADFLTGRLAGYEQSIGNTSFSKANYVGVYGQDTWQVTPRLVMNAGLRWAPILPIMDFRRPVPNVLNFDLNRYYQGLRSTVFVNAPPGMLYAGDPGFAQKNNGANAAKPKADLFNPRWAQFSPRLGLAWDVQGNGRTSVRASYGLSYEDYQLSYMQGTFVNQPPWGFATRLVTPTGGFDDLWRDVPGGDPYPINFSKNMPWVPSASYMPNLADLPSTYTQSWNLSLQREIVAGTLVSVSYLGSQVTHLQAAHPLNSVIYIPGSGNANGECFLNGQAAYFKVAPGALCSTVANSEARRTLALQRPQFVNEIGSMGIVTNGGTQNYHGMLVSVQRRLSGGVNLNANYTWSHCIGDLAPRYAQAPAADMTYQDPNDRRRDRGNCEHDQRHNLNMTGVAETPKFANRTLSLLATGWRLSGIYRRFTAGATIGAASNTGFRTVTFDNDSSGSGTIGATDPCRCQVRSQRPNVVLANVYLDRSGRPGTQYLNPAAFATPTLGTLGNLGRATLQLPTAWQFDLSLARVFRFRETQSMEFRAEAYNVTNSFRTGDIDPFLTSSNFGKIRNALDPRILQFALKYAF